MRTLHDDRMVSRRTALRLLGTTVAIGCVAGCVSGDGAASSCNKLSSEDDAFLEELERAAFLFFWENTHPRTGLTKDRSRADGVDARTVASIAAQGFGLTALCIADQRKWKPSHEIRERVATSLRFLLEQLPNEHGFFFHFVNYGSGAREWKCELSSIDTTLLLCGVLTCAAHFSRDREIGKTASQIYERVDWRWMLNGGKTFSHGWKPESGFLKSRWDEYCEHMMLYLLAIGSPSHPIPPDAWHEWRRPLFTFGGKTYINPSAPLFVHQYSHAWFHFRGRRDRYADYYENSEIATDAHREFCFSLRDKYPHFHENLWGITSSDSAKGYEAWGGPPAQGAVDGTVVPCAPAGSLPFRPRECIAALRHMRDAYGEKVWKRYGFVDAFNPATGWHAPDVIGIDVGISLLMAENLRSGYVWKTFMRNEAAERGMRLAGFEKSAQEQ